MEAVDVSNSVERMVTVDETETVTVFVRVTEADGVETTTGGVDDEEDDGGEDEEDEEEEEVDTGTPVLMQLQALEIRAASLLQAEAKVGRGPVNMLVVKAPQKALAEDSLAVFCRPRAQLSAQAAQTGEAPMRPTRARALKCIFADGFHKTCK
jgi:hypothetical protein